LATADDHRAGARDERNLAVARRQVGLEVQSTFAFQGNRWLGDTLVDILSPETREAVRDAKARAELRENAEKGIPKHLLYVKGWPVGLPTRAEAALLADVRKRVARAVGLNQTFDRPDDIVARYQELLDLKRNRD
jgi:hypothetical protein